MSRVVLLMNDLSYSAFLGQEKHKITEMWRESVYAQVALCEQEDRLSYQLALQDHIAFLLEDLDQKISSKKNHPFPDLILDYEKFSLSQIVQELFILRMVILELIESKEKFVGKEKEQEKWILLQVFDQLVQNTIDQHSLKIDQRQEKISKELGPTLDRFNLASQSGQTALWERNLTTDEFWGSENHPFLYGLDEKPKCWNFSEFYNHVHPDDLPRVKSILQSLMNLDKQEMADDPTNNSYRVIWPDGSIHWLLVKGQLVSCHNSHEKKFSGIITDITDLKLMEEKYKKSEERLSMILEASHAGIWEWDFKNKHLYVNETIKRFFGITAQEDHCNSEDFQSKLFPGDYEEFRRVCRESIDHKKDFCLELRIFNPDDSVRWLLNSGRIICNENGSPLRMLGMILDITERKEFEIKLREEQRKLQAILDYSPNIIYLKDLQGRYLLINKRYLSLMNLREDEILGINDRQLFDPQIAECFIENDTKVMREKKSFSFDESLNIKGNNTTYLSIKFPIYDHHGEIKGIGGISNDITELKMAEKKQKCLMEQFQSATRRLQDLQEIAEKALAREINLEELLGNFLLYVKKSFQGDAMTMALFEEEEKSLVVKAFLAVGEDKITRSHTVIPDGNYFIWKIFKNKCPIMLDNLEGCTFEFALESHENKGIQSLIGVPLRTRLGVIGVIHVGSLKKNYFSQDDLSLLQLIADRMSTSIDNIKLYSEVQGNMHRLEVEKSLRERFVFTLGHDLRGPLTAAKGSAQILLKYADKINNKESFLQRIIEYLDRADQMIQDLLDAHLLKAGKTLPLPFEKFELYSILQDAIDGLTFIHGDRFIFKMDSRWNPSEGFWNQEGIRRMVENILSNAVKYGDVGREITLSVNYSPENEKVAISIHNWGDPLTKEEQVKMFDQFSRTTAARKSGQRGWGIGLTLVKGLAETHGGRVFVESQINQGTTFTIELPLDSRKVFP